MARLKAKTAASMAPAAVCLTLAAVPVSTSAAGIPAIDIQAQGGYWQPIPTGTVSSDGDSIDVEDELGFDRNEAATFMANLEHPVPLLPNVRVRHFSADDSAKGEVERSRTFRGVTFTRREKVRSEYDLTTTDATFYYSPLNNWAQLDIGVTTRRFDVEVLIESREDNDRERAAGEAIIPMGHLGARFDLPLAGLYVSGDLDIISADDNSITDTRAAVGYQIIDNFEVEGGYRRLSLDIEDVDDISADTDFEGGYVAATLRF
jgi:outer membrane protein